MIVDNSPPLLRGLEFNQSVTIFQQLLKPGFRRKDYH